MRPLLAFLLTALVLAVPAGAQQDLRSPDARDAAQAAPNLQRRQDVFDRPEVRVVRDRPQIRVVHDPETPWLLLGGVGVGCALLGGAAGRRLRVRVA
ncbi:MAG TPA: hypothetical protein VF121_02250 [Thermoanaerobaculia bacterium]|nr:hypothetical protein [Thermoanaerobaculia bacterium]